MVDYEIIKNLLEIILNSMGHEVVIVDSFISEPEIYIEVKGYFGAKPLEYFKEILPEYIEDCCINNELEWYIELTNIKQNPNNIFGFLFKAYGEEDKNMSTDKAGNVLQDKEGIDLENSYSLKQVETTSDKDNININIIQKTNINNMNPKHKYINSTNYLYKKENSICWLRTVMKRVTYKKNKNGEKKPYPAYATYISKKLLDTISPYESITYVYIYEYNQSYYLSITQPDKSMTGKIRKLKLNISVSKNSKNYQTALKEANRTISLPQNFWNSLDNKVCEIILYNKKDFVNPEQPLVEIKIKKLDYNIINPEDEGTAINELLNK